MLCAWARLPHLAPSCVQRSTPKRVHLHCRHVCSAASQAPVTVAQPPQQDWQSILTQQVEGEYEGVSATFMPDGTPEELPPHLVPEAYREWGVQVHDWQTQCSAGAAADELRYTLKRLMPTVGVREEVPSVQCLKDSPACLLSLAALPVHRAAGSICAVLTLDQACLRC